MSKIITYNLIVILLLFIVSTLSFSQGYQDTDDLATLVKRGKQALKTARFDEAINYFTKAIAIDKNYTPSYFYRGQAFLLSKNFVNAIRDFTEFLKREPDNPKVYYFRGLAHYHAGNYREAIIDLTKAKQLKPSLINVYNIRGLALLKSKKYKWAIRDFKTFISFKPRAYPLVHFHLGYALEKVNNKRDAITSYRNFIHFSNNEKLKEEAKRRIRHLQGESTHPSSNTTNNTEFNDTNKKDEFADNDFKKNEEFN